MLPTLDRVPSGQALVSAEHAVDLAVAAVEEGEHAIGEVREEAVDPHLQHRPQRAPGEVVDVHLHQPGPALAHQPGEGAVDVDRVQKQGPAGLEQACRLDQVGHRIDQVFDPIRRNAPKIRVHHSARFHIESARRLKNRPKGCPLSPGPPIPLIATTNSLKFN